MSCNNNIAVTNNQEELNDPFDSPYTHYNHYSTAFQNTFNNKISSSQKRLNGTNNCTPFCPLYLIIIVVPLVINFKNGLIKEIMVIYVFNLMILLVV